MKLSYSNKKEKKMSWCAVKQINQTRNSCTKAKDPLCPIIYPWLVVGCVVEQMDSFLLQRALQRSKTPLRLVLELTFLNEYFLMIITVSLTPPLQVVLIYARFQNNLATILLALVKRHFFCLGKTTISLALVKQLFFSLGKETISLVFVKEPFY